MKLFLISLDEYFESLFFLNNKLIFTYNIEFQYYLTI